MNKLQKGAQKVPQFLNSLAKAEFSKVVPKAKMELTIRTPYQTLVETTTEFNGCYIYSNQGYQCISNKSPPKVFGLPASKIYITPSGSFPEIFHMGGYCISHPDNRLEINLVDGYTRDEINFDKVELPELPEGGSKADQQTRVISKRAHSTFLRHAKSIK
eukprot:CAMPEP_0115007570 /NCGR_PEP_ID=MMETSP0216-20121206/21283_1 /TAXON_ID=223996 /ORGANISM="Protocruzia adherens, Strain Boccale" /LENGTH=159 /DNA_ID=CAMNT_0002374587 /DNA_START=30 /DNA_END=509 /DNA_ORIENTATION=+